MCEIDDWLTCSVAASFSCENLVSSVIFLPRSLPLSLLSLPLPPPPFLLLQSSLFFSPLPPSSSCSISPLFSFVFCANFIVRCHPLYLAVMPLKMDVSCINLYLAHIIILFDEITGDNFTFFVFNVINKVGAHRVLIWIFVLLYQTRNLAAIEIGLERRMLLKDGCVKTIHIETQKSLKTSGLTMRFSFNFDSTFSPQLELSSSNNKKKIESFHPSSASMLWRGKDTGN